ncbi:leucyl aminopeptidase family protein, partial [Falsiroseomonas oryzae]|uniref:leucyl aminopeptidase family protein n=1 Tax=Falsiroseomonas oryzae TaxID=2766473 RepID=UPI0022EB8FBD
LRRAAEASGFRGEAGQVLEPAAAPRQALLGIGRRRRADLERAGACGAALFAEISQVALDARGLAPEESAALATGAALRAWRFDAHRTRDVTPGLARLVVHVDDVAAAKAAWEPAEAAVRGCLFARDLVAEPANHLTTRSFAKRLEGLAEFGIDVDVLGRKRLARAGFGGLLAVGQGSASPPRLVVLRWRGSLDAPPVAFVGKGIVFDTGGVSIKPAHGMETMRADMAGAAACAGAILALALRRSPAPAVAVLALAENATGAGSYRPSDVIRTLSGRTVEVVDTDAEGRLVLADAIHHAVAQFRPRAVVDLATLTGAIVSALGHHRAGLFGNDQALMAALAAAGEQVNEPLWPMPIGEQHRDDLRSDIADIRQCAPSARGEGGWAARFLPDACHAAAFLREFAGEARWAHLDIAGVDTAEAPHALGPAGPTGFGVRLLDALVAAGFEEADHHAPVAGGFVPV